MRLEQMRDFLVIAESASISQAARRLFISHQGLNRALKSFEQELGAKLVDRSFDGIRLTPEGEIARGYCERFVSLYDELGRELNRLHAGATQVAPEFLGTQHTIASLFDCVDADRISRERQRALSELLSLLEKGSDDLFALDLVFDRMPDRVELPNCDFVPVYLTKPGLCVSREHFDCSEASISPEEAAAKPLVVIEDATVDSIVEAVFYQMKPNIIAKTTNGSVFRRLIAEGRGCGLFDSLTYEKYRSSVPNREDFAFVPLATGCCIVVGFAYRLDSATAPLLRQIAEDALQAFNESLPGYADAYPLRLSA